MPGVLRQNADGSVAFVDVRTGREMVRYDQLTEAVTHGGSYNPYLFDDFLGPALSAVNWTHPTKGSDGATLDFVFDVGVNGRVKGTTGAGAGANMATNGIQINSSLNWKANQGGLFIEARLQLSAITNISCFVGFTDQVSALECPINSAASANTITTTATDAAGFMFDTSMTTARWWAQAVANDVDATGVVTANAPVAATYDKLRVELDSSGNATFFLNDVATGPIATCVTATVGLTPVVTVFTRTAASATCLIDYIAVGATRA